MEKRKIVAKWLSDKFLEWLQKEGEVKTKKDFAEYLRVEQTLVIKWLKGSTLPGNENVIKIGNRLGFEIYDLLGWERPEPPEG
jgi:transcriptional regulator with XRE-family HTH domain